MKKILIFFTDLTAAINPVFAASNLIYEIGNVSNYDDRDDYDKWHRISLSHELQDSRTTKLRVEIYTLKSNQLKFDRVQLEKE